MFTQEKYSKALNFAAKAHGEQKTQYGLPYISYLSLVAMEVLHACQEGQVELEKTDFVITLAILQDTLEKTDITYDELYKEFSAEVAEGVDAMTKDKDLSTKEQLVDSINRLLTQGYDVQMITLANTIVKMQKPPETWSSQEIFNFHKESKFILSCLKNSNLHLSKRLEDKINNYIVYIK